MTDIYVEELDLLPNQRIWGATIVEGEANKMVGATMLDVVKSTIRLHGTISQCRIVLKRPDYPWGKDWTAKSADRFYSRKP